MKCTGCGAPLETGTEICPYCGMATPYGESLAEDKLEQKREAERKKRLEGLPAMKYVAGAFIPVLYFLTFFCYSPYWYATRMAKLNSLGTRAKLAAWAVGLHALLWFCVLMLPNGGLGLSFLPVDGQTLFEYALGVDIVLSGWIAFKARDVLQEYASQTMERSVAIMTVVPSNMMLLLFGPMYLQYQVNRMISAELLAPQI